MSEGTVSVLGVAFAAYCVWLTVRIINRRERWAKWTAAVTVGLPLLYVASLGPACWLVGDLADASETVIDAIPIAYYPVLWLARITRSEVAPGEFALSRVDGWIEWYATLARSDGAYPGHRLNGERTWFFK